MKYSLQAWHVALALAISITVGFVTYSLAIHRSPVAIIEETTIPSPQALFGKPSILVLAEGLDYDYTDSDIETSAHSRSDIIMAIRMDFAHRRIYELSVPRDMVATLPNGRQTKINDAQSEGGITEAESVVATWLGIPGFDRYVILRIDAMKDLINAIGGVDVYVKNSTCLLTHTDCTHGTVDYDDTWGHLHVHLVEGLQHLNGAQAVGYARFRHDFCSDPCRIMRQQDVIRAIVARLRSNGLNAVFTIGPLLAALNRDVTTNLSPQEELSIAYAFRGITPNSIHTTQVPYVSDVVLPGEGDSIVPDEAAKRRLVLEYLEPSASR